MLEPMSDAEDSDAEDSDAEEEEEESEEVSEGDSGSEYEEDSADEDYVPEDPYARLQGLKRVFVPEEGPRRPEDPWQCPQDRATRRRMTPRWQRRRRRR